MKYAVAALIGMCVLFYIEEVRAHEMTPTYPKWEVSHVEGVHKTRVSMFNKRMDVEWYEVGVFTKDWEPIPFVSQYKLVHMPYLSHVDIDIYVNSVDTILAEYVCSVSKLRDNSDKKPMLSSRICSKFK